MLVEFLLFLIFGLLQPVTADISAGTRSEPPRKEKALFRTANSGVLKSKVKRAKSPWLSPEWLNLYQYEKRFWGGYLSDIKSRRFFFSDLGPQSPKTEYYAALKAFNSETKKWGTQNQPAACVFPARQQVLSRLSGQIFPKVSCPDLQEWTENIGANQVSLVFAGAYSGNPASILGHTFLRFYNSNRQDYGQKLLSYSVGYLAIPDPNDSRISYMIKGLTGGYPGGYDIEAHYIKVGLYNNSESRDLWEWPLELTDQETALLVKHIWELTFNAELRYYFIDENCSYRILRALDVVRPRARFAEKMGGVVIPSETVRLADQAGLLSGQLHYRASIERRIKRRLSKMTADQVKVYHQARKDKEFLKTIQSSLVLDTLIDYWMHRNFKEKAKMKEQDRQMMDLTYRQRAKVKESLPNEVKDNEIKEYFGLQSILEGHKANHISLMGNPSSGREVWNVSQRLGLQPDWMNTKGYSSVNQVEYLGFSILGDHQADFAERAKTRWEALLARVKALSAFNDFHPKWSWGFDLLIQNDCLLCGEDNRDQPHLNISAMGGGSLIFGNEYFYLMPMAQFKFWESDGLKVAAPLGLLVGGIVEIDKLKILAEYQELWWGRRHHTHMNLNLSYLMSQNTALRFRSENDWLDRAQGKARNFLGLAHFF